MELKYSNHENAAVYVALANILVDRIEGGSIYHSVFASQDMIATLATSLAAVAAVVATKFFDDIYFSNEYYAQELGFSLSEMNEMEVAFIAMLDYRLNLDIATFQLALRCFDQSRLKVCDNKAFSGLIEQLPVSPELLLALNYSCCCSNNESQKSINEIKSDWPEFVDEDRHPGSLPRLPASSSTQSSCSTTDTAIMGNQRCSKDSCLCVKKLTEATQKQVLEFLQRRTLQNHRLETEQEQLCDARLHIKARCISKLLTQAREEVLLTS